MKKLLTLLAGLTVAVSLTTVDLMATSAIGKKHAKPGKGGAKINCAYCHTTAKVGKEKGAGDAKNSNEYCNAAGCHK